MKLLGIKYQGYIGDPKILLYSYYNADFAGDKLIQKSVSGNIYFFTSRVVLYLSKRQQIIAQSTTKVEYYTLAKAVSKVLQLKQIMGQMMYLGVNIKSVHLYSDN